MFDMRNDGLFFLYAYSTILYIFPFRVSMYIKRKIDERSTHRVSVNFEFVAILFSGIWYTISRNVVKPFISIDCFIVTLHLSLPLFLFSKKDRHEDSFKIT